MNLRLLIFLLCLVLSSALSNWLFAHVWLERAGVMLAAIAWFFWDRSQGLKVLDWLFRPRKLEPPKVFGIWQEVIDSTQREIKKLVAKSQRREERFENFLSALQSSPNGVILLDRDLALEWCNQTAAHHLGLEVERDAGQILTNLVRHPDFVHYLHAQRFHERITIDSRHAQSSMPLRIAVQAHRYGNAKFLLLSQDITSLEQAEAMRRDFVANVSHEIRTPLTVLAGYVESLQTLDLSAQEQKQILARMAQQSSRMQDLVSDLLTLSKLEDGSPMVQKWFKLKPVLLSCWDEAKGLSQSLNHAHQFKLELDDALSDVELQGSESEVHSAIANLLSNAVRYTPAGKLVQLAVRLHDGQSEHSGHSVHAGIEVRVSDEGPGIALEHIPRLTERFYRVDGSRSRESGGTGLGLAIVKHALARHAAHLEIQSTLGRGSHFSIHIPASKLRGSSIQPLAALQRLSHKVSGSKST